MITPKLIKDREEKGRLHIDPHPCRVSRLSAKKNSKRSIPSPIFRMRPDINVMKIGGQSIVDRGGNALFPIFNALIDAKDKQKILLMPGGEMHSFSDGFLGDLRQFHFPKMLGKYLGVGI